MDSRLAEIRRARRRAPLRARRASIAEVTLTDDRNMRGLDARRDNNAEQDKLRDWAHELGVTEDALKTAMLQVGNAPDDVERYLKNKADDGAPTG